MKIKYYAEVLGAHVHVRVFVGSTDTNLALAGTLVLRQEEYAEFKKERGMLKKLAHTLERFHRDVQERGDSLREEIEDAWCQCEGEDILREAQNYDTEV